MHLNKWRTAKLLLFTLAILLCQNSGAAPGADPAIQGIWCLNFSPPYMVPSRQLVESYFHLKLSPATNGKFSGRALWNFGVMPDDRARRVSASVAGQIEPDKNISIQLLESYDKGGFLLLLKGKFDGPDIIKGIVDSGSSADLAWSPLKWSKKMPTSGTFTLRRLKSEEEKYVEALFEKQKN